MSLIGKHDGQDQEGVRGDAGAGGCLEYCVVTEARNMDMRRRKQTEAVVGRKVRFELQVGRNLGGRGQM